MIKQLNTLLCGTFFLLLNGLFACSQGLPPKDQVVENQAVDQQELILGNERVDEYFPMLQHKNIGFVGNHTSVIDSLHMVDYLLERSFSVKVVFSPEHGFRGKADAGENVKNSIDQLTGLPIVSLYGDNKKPTKEQLEEVDVFLFDIQDVGARFYTYISTLHYVMEAAAENNIPLILLDRPNPNGHYVDGPILEENYRSFVGMHPVPIVHGLTIGEYAKMINGEKWLAKGQSCDLTIISCLNYKRKDRYEPPIAPSPNLPNLRSIYLYPSLCLFEGTVISVGRGTDYPFQQVGNPTLLEFKDYFTPKETEGAKKPKLLGQKCYGLNFSTVSVDSLQQMEQLDLSFLIQFYESYDQKEMFFNNFFNLLAGNSSLKKAIQDGKSTQEIRASWEKGLVDYKEMREKYLLYP